MDITGGISRFAGFLTTDIWRVRMEDLHGAKKHLVRSLRIVLIAAEKFFEDRCTLRASSLTFFSLLSVVPVLAMAFAIATGFGLQNRLEQLIFEQFAGQEQVISRLVDFSRNLLQKTSGGYIAGVGAAFLFWAVISIIGSAEGSFNHIWEIRKPRTIGRKLTDYLAVMLISPLLFVVSSSATVLIITQINRLLETFGILGILSPFFTVLIRIIPLALIWMLFIFIYLFLPNVKVHWSSGILGGIIAGTAFAILQWAYIYFQIGVTYYNAVYGSFAALPLFVIWLQLSWYIVLFGVELSYAHQNEEYFEFRPDIRKVSHSFRRILSLMIMHLVVKNFSKSNPPLNGRQISSRLEIPLKLAQDLLDDLTAASLLTAIPTEEYRQSAYQPARPIDTISILNVIEALESRGGFSTPVAHNESFRSLSHALTEFSEAIKSSPENRLLKDI